MANKGCLLMQSNVTFVTDRKHVSPIFHNMVSSTDRYYDEHAVKYYERTVVADMSHLYDRFLPMLPTGGRILDAGCGSGRDLRVFSERGFRAEGIDASLALAEMARAYSGAPCAVGRIEDVAEEGCFDGIWACASLLHLPKATLVPALGRLRRALVPGGAIYASVQEGEGEQLMGDGRYFAFYRPEEFLAAVERAGFSVENSWISDDVLQGRTGTRWINVLATSSAAASGDGVSD